VAAVFDMRSRAGAGAGTSADAGSRGGSAPSGAPVIRSLRYCGFRCSVRTLPHPDPELAPIVLVGGAFQRLDGWGRVEARLAERTTLITVDPPGWGGADLLPARYGYAFIAHALRHLLDAAGHRRIHLFGGSYGAAVAFRYARLYPADVESVALIGAAARLPRPLRAKLRRVVSLLHSGRRDQFAAAATDLVLARTPGAEVARGHAVRRILHGIFHRADGAAAEIFAANTQRLLGGGLYPPGPPLHLPVLLGTGEHDRFTSPHLCQEVAAHCTDSRFVLLPDADHAVHLEVPDALSDLLLGFFRGHRAAA
jgi:pimeloyl-ACP methyl ester carboxylesterase